MNTMTKRIVLLWVMVACISSFLRAQDFVGRFMKHRMSDSNLECISISPKMIEEVLDVKADANNDLLDVISELKSVQILSANVEGKSYYREAENLLIENAGRFESFASYKGGDMNSQILVRRWGNKIVELVMLVNEGDEFSVINFTGDMNDEFITRISKSAWTNHH